MVWYAAERAELRRRCERRAGAIRCLNAMAHYKARPGAVRVSVARNRSIQVRESGLWKKGRREQSWNQISKENNAGGLGIKNLKKQNEAFVKNSVGNWLLIEMLCGYVQSHHAKASNSADKVLEGCEERKVLNNNPETFGPEHRPILEFAVDNVQTLELRKTKLQSQQQAAVHSDSNVEEYEESGFHTNRKDRKRKLEAHDKPVKDSVLDKDESACTLPNQNAKRQKGNRKSNKTEGSSSSQKENSKALSMKPNNHQDDQNHGGS
ncbi:hypothetical protein K1719_032763 [Acacia pycnantha]|nr:hypothetical protein K1719_032763 [Acacia pycnantha]